MMKKLMFVTLGIAALAIGGQPVAAQAQVADAIQAVNDAIVELTDAPAWASARRSIWRSDGGPTVPSSTAPRQSCRMGSARLSLAELVPMPCVS
jgi:hypothetical protein